MSILLSGSTGCRFLYDGEKKERSDQSLNKQVHLSGTMVMLGRGNPTTVLGYLREER